MNLQADIKWIKQELTNVRDPHLIEAFKNLLAYRKTNKELISSSDEELEKSLNRALADVEEGRVKSHIEIKKKYQQWL